MDTKLYTRRIDGLHLRSLRLVRYCPVHQLSIIDGEACHACSILETRFR